jgi:glucokinase
VNDRRRSSIPTIAAFDVGGTRIKAGIVHNVSVPLLKTATMDGDLQANEAFARIVALGRQLLEQHDVTAIGICIRGIVDSQSGVLLEVNGPLSGLNGQPLVQMLANEFGYPTVMENDARMYALGEWLYGAGQGYQNMVCITLGTGVGSGVVLGGHLLRGSRHVAGILGGHLTVEADGPLCTCGNAGCLEALIGTSALIRRVTKALATGRPSLLRAEPLTPRLIFEAAAAGDLLAQEVVQYFAEKLGVGIVTMIHAYDPDIVVLGGGLARSSVLFLPMVQAYVNEHAWTIPRGRVPIIPATLDDSAALLGIAAFARDEISLL